MNSSPNIAAVDSADASGFNAFIFTPEEACEVNDQALARLRASRAGAVETGERAPTRERRKLSHERRRSGATASWSLGAFEPAAAMED